MFDDPRHALIGQFSALLDHCASLLPYIAEYEDQELYHVWDACTTSFTTDFRALHGFMLANRDNRDAHRTDFTRGWRPNRKTAPVKRLEKFYTFTHVHRAHLSWSRFEYPRGDLSDWVPPEYLDGGRLTAAGYARILSDYLDVLNEFIPNIPSQDEQQRFRTPVVMARRKVNSFMGLPKSA